MNKLSVFCLILLFAGPAVSAQTRYRGFAEAGCGFLAGNKTESVYQVGTSHGVLFGSFFLGAGLGLDYYAVNNPGCLSMLSISS